MYLPISWNFWIPSYHHQYWKFLSNGCYFICYSHDFLLSSSHAEFEKKRLRWNEIKSIVIKWIFIEQNSNFSFHLEANENITNSGFQETFARPQYAQSFQFFAAHISHTRDVKVHIWIWSIFLDRAAWVNQI